MEIEYKVEGRIGRWYEIDRKTVNNDTYLLVEHCTYGDEAGCLVIKLPNNPNFTDKGTKRVYDTPAECEIIETWDDIETALTDAEII